VAQKITDDFKQDMVKATELYEEIKVQRRCRNHQHKQIRAIKRERDALIDGVKSLIDTVQEAKSCRDNANAMAKEFKELRDDAVISLRAAKKINNKKEHKNFDDAQQGYHEDMLKKTEESQEYQAKIEELNLVILKNNNIASEKHEAMVLIHKKAEEFHAKMVAAIRAVDMIKAKHSIDFINYGEEE
jgi:uncharacterized coiled-coil DUF342 family protein